MIHIFIINHYAGNKDMAKDLREKLALRKDIRYFVFNTMRAGFERDLVEKIMKYFEGEVIRFYCCGGSGTMRNMLNGLDSFDKVEVAFFPCGLSNDFLKCFDNSEAFSSIENLIDGKVVELDYIKTDYGVALNTLSVGFDSKVGKSMQRLRLYDVFGSQVPYFLSLISGIFIEKPKPIEITMDGAVEAERYAEIIFGNGCVLGGNLFFTERNSVTDGKASYLTAKDVSGWEALNMVMKIMKRKLRKINKKVTFGQCRTMEIKGLDGAPFFINLDGELVECMDKCRAEIVPGGLKFVVPQSVEIKDYILN